MRSYDIVQKEQDLTALEWGERVNSSGTAGTYLKARTGQGARAIYYKLLGTTESSLMDTSA